MSKTRQWDSLYYQEMSSKKEKFCNLPYSIYEMVSPHSTYTDKLHTCIPKKVNLNKKNFERNTSLTHFFFSHFIRFVGDLWTLNHWNSSFKFLEKFQSWRTAHSIGMAYNTKTCSVRCRRNDIFTDVTKSVESFGLVDSLLWCHQ